MQAEFIMRNQRSYLKFGLFLFDKDYSYIYNINCNQFGRKWNKNFIKGEK